MAENKPQESKQKEKKPQGTKENKKSQMNGQGTREEAPNAETPAAEEEIIREGKEEVKPVKKNKPKKQDKEMADDKPQESERKGQKQKPEKGKKNKKDEEHSDALLPEIQKGDKPERDGKKKGKKKEQMERPPTEEITNKVEGIDINKDTTPEPASEAAAGEAGETLAAEEKQEEDISGIYQKSHIKLLMKKTIGYIDKIAECEIKYIYRNKSNEHFENIKKQQGEDKGIMKPYTKDNSGDQRNPINGRIKSLFFCATLYNGDLPTISSYGNTRIIIPIDKIWQETTHLYFSDFFCFEKDKENPFKNHYVILVLTKEGSDAYKFCKNHLVELDKNDNPFLRKDGNKFKILEKPHVWLELAITFAIDLNQDFVQWEVEKYDNKETIGNLEKNDKCTTCNIGIQSTIA